MSLDQFEREQKVQEVQEAVYRELLRQTDHLNEPERRFYFIAVVMRILEGVQISKQADLMKADFLKDTQ